MSEWRTIESAPKEGQNILLYCPLPGSEFQVVGLWVEGCWATSYEWEDVYEPTHWMPLPSPPNEGEPL